MTDAQRLYRQRVWLQLHGSRCDVMEATVHPRVCKLRAQQKNPFNTHDMQQNWNISLVGRYSRNECFGCEKYRKAS